MGEFVRYLSKISKNYSIYVVVVVVNRYGSTAEKVIDENFEKIAYDIGEKAVISKLLNGFRLDLANIEIRQYSKATKYSTTT